MNTRATYTFSACARASESNGWTAAPSKLRVMVRATLCTRFAVRRSPLVPCIAKILPHSALVPPCAATHHAARSRRGCVTLIVRVIVSAGRRRRRRSGRRRRWLVTRRIPRSASRRLVRRRRRLRIGLPDKTQRGVIRAADTSTPIRPFTPLSSPLPPASHSGHRAPRSPPTAPPPCTWTASEE